MVTHYMLRTCVGKEAYIEKYLKFATAVNVIKPPHSLHKSTMYYELPSNICTMLKIVPYSAQELPDICDATCTANMLTEHRILF